MSQRDIVIVLVTGFAILFCFQVLNHLKIDNPYVTFAVLVAVMAGVGAIFQQRS